MSLLKLAAVGIPLILLILGAMAAFTSHPNESADEAGFTEAFGMVVVILAGALIVVEAVGALIWWAVT